MDIEQQREIIRLWNRMRRIEGPVAEEIRIQILECFGEPGKAKRAVDGVRPGIGRPRVSRQRGEIVQLAGRRISRHARGDGGSRGAALATGSGGMVAT